MVRTLQCSCRQFSMVGVNAVKQDKIYKSRERRWTCFFCAKLFLYRFCELDRQITL